MALQKTAFVDKMRNPRTRIYLPELFEEINSYETDEERVETIKQYVNKSQENSTLLCDYLQSIYHPAVKLDLPDSIPPYDNTKYVDYDMAPTTLSAGLKRIKYFVKGHSSYIEKLVKRENVFIQILEGMHSKDSLLYSYILLKKFPKETYQNLGIAVFNKAWPEVFVDVDVDDYTKSEKDELAKLKKSLTKAKK